MTRSLFNHLGAALAGVQLISSLPPAMQPVGAVPCHLPKRTELTYKRLAGLETHGMCLQARRNPFPQRRKAIQFAVLAGLSLLPASVLQEGCQPADALPSAINTQLIQEVA